MTPVWLLCQHVYRFVDRVPHNDVGSMLEEDSLIVAEPIIVEQKELSPLTVRNALSRCESPSQRHQRPVRLVHHLRSAQMVIQSLLATLQLQMFNMR